MNMTTNAILIAGGATGIGLTLAQELSERGNRVIVCGLHQQPLQKAQSEAPKLVTRVCDITNA
jgi:uncharacterized oxidoreductase